MSKGPYKYSEMSGAKCMPKSKSNLTGSGKMSGAHGLNSDNSTKGMRHPEGRLGAGCPGFKSESYPQAGPKANGHAKQPKGHGE